MIILPVQDNIGLAVFMLVLTPIVFTSFILCAFRSPGYLEPVHDFLELLSKVHPSEMCPECKVLRTPRSRHCTICNRCIERFDHHCPWMNNCIGVGNNNAFLTFLFSLSTSQLTAIGSSIYSAISPCNLEAGECPLDVLC